GKHRVPDNAEGQLGELARAADIEVRGKPGEQSVLAPDEPVVDVAIDAETGVGCEAAALQCAAYRPVHPGDDQREAAPRSDLAEPDKTDHGRRVDSRHMAEVDD